MTRHIKTLPKRLTVGTATTYVSANGVEPAQPTWSNPKNNVTPYANRRSYTNADKHLPLNYMLSLMSNHRLKVERVGFQPSPTPH